MAKQGSVGPSRSGDQFHYQWAARQCLGLLAAADGLVAVTIEGASLDEGDASTSVGDEVIDVGLYYGSEDVMAAKSIRYMQLKHSSKHAHDPWTASGLKGTIEGFAGRFTKLEASLGLDVLQKKVRFVFLTNRPMAEDVLEALADLASGSTAPRHRKTDELLKRYGASAGCNLQSFFSVFSVEAGEPDLWEQRNCEPAHGLGERWEGPGMGGKAREGSKNQGLRRDGRQIRRDTSASNGLLQHFGGWF